MSDILKHRKLRNMLEWKTVQSPKDLFSELKLRALEKVKIERTNVLSNNVSKSFSQTHSKTVKHNGAERAVKARSLYWSRVRNRTNVLEYYIDKHNDLPVHSLNFSHVLHCSSFS